jgi:hypothetical protein
VRPPDGDRLYELHPAVPRGVRPPVRAEAVLVKGEGPGRRPADEIAGALLRQVEDDHLLVDAGRVAATGKEKEERQRSERGRTDGSPPGPLGPLRL